MSLQDVMRVDNGNIISGSGAGGGSKNFQGTIEEWNTLTNAEKKAYDHASIPNSIGGDITFPANKVIMTGGGNVEDAVDEVIEKTNSLHLKMDQIFYKSNIPTTATSYSCDWTKYDTLVITASQYGNHTCSVEVPISYFQNTEQNRRVIINDFITGVNFEVYKNGNDAIYIKANELSSKAVIFVYGTYIGV